MVVIVSRRSSVAWLRLSLHFDEVLPTDSELDRGGLDVGFVDDVWSAVEGVWGVFGKEEFKPPEVAPFESM